eukprot:UN11115
MGWPIIFMVQFFVWEIWFDFCHYWAHRVAHTIPFLKIGHGKHHESGAPDAFDTFVLSWDDMLITNMLPNILSMYITCTLLFGRNFSMLEYHILWSYKEFVEVNT